jgi:putative phosphoesterase
LQRIAVISDVHANLEALEEVLRRVEGMEVYCLGDLVDYGANPNEVIDTVRKRGVRSIMGNHDFAALTGDTSLFNPKAAMSSIWTAKHLSQASVEYLRGLEQEMKLSFEGSNVYFVHGSPDDKLWEYVDPSTHSNLFGHYLAKLRVDMIGLGHTHIPYVWNEEGKVVFNPGSVGQPRDGNWRASFAIVSFEGSKTEVEIRRVEYDVEKAASKIRAAGLPESHAQRLAAGS